MKYWRPQVYYPKCVNFLHHHFRPALERCFVLHVKGMLDKQLSSIWHAAQSICQALDGNGGVQIWHIFDIFEILKIFFTFNMQKISTISKISETCRMCRKFPAPGYMYAPPSLFWYESDKDLWAHFRVTWLTYCIYSLLLSYITSHAFSAMILSVINIDVKWPTNYCLLSHRSSECQLMISQQISNTNNESQY